MNIYNRSIHEHSRCLLMSASSLFILIILLLIQRLKIQSDSSIQKVVSRLTQVQCEITDDNGDDSTSEMDQNYTKILYPNSPDSSKSSPWFFLTTKFFSLFIFILNSGPL